MEITFRERDVNRCANSYGAVVIPIIFLASLQMASRIYLTISNFQWLMSKVKRFSCLAPAQNTHADVVYHDI